MKMVPKKRQKSSLVLDLLIADRFGRPEPHYDDRKLLAEKARYFATDVVADWSDPKSPPR